MYQLDFNDKEFLVVQILLVCLALKYIRLRLYSYCFNIRLINLTDGNRSVFEMTKLCWKRSASSEVLVI